jgi:hypothetical protein
MRIPWKTGLIGLATASLLAAALAGTLILHRASATPPVPQHPEGRAVASQTVFPPDPARWVDDLGGVIPRPPNVSIVPFCQPDDLTLSVRSDHASYGSGQIVTFVFDARFKGGSACRIGAPCFPDVVVRNADNTEIWHWYGEVAGGICAGTPAALVSKASQHLEVTAHWRQDDCGLFCHDASRSQAAPAGQYTVTASWPPYGSTHSESFALR